MSGFIQQGTRVVVEATGRAGRVFSHHTNPSNERLYGVRFDDPSPTAKRRRQKSRKSVECYCTREELTLTDSNVSFGG